MLLSRIIDGFVSRLREKKFQGPVRYAELVEALRVELSREVKLIDGREVFLEWVSRNCESATPLGKWLGAMAPGVVPRAVGEVGTVVKWVEGTEVAEMELSRDWISEDEGEKGRCVLI
jgi:hypothetical protein